MPRKLTKLKLDRVDLVAEGANPAAHIELFKQATDSVEKATFADIQDARTLGDMLSEVCKYTWDLQDAIYSSLYSDGDRASEVRMSVQQFSDAVEKALSSWVKGVPAYKSVEAKAAGDLVVAQLTKMKERLTTILKEAPVKTEVEAPVVTPESIQKQIADAVDKARAETTAEIAKAKAEADEKVASFQKAAEEATAKAAAAEATAQVEKEKRERSEFVTKATKEFSGLPGTPDEIGGVLMALSKAAEKESLTKEEHEMVLKFLAAGHASLTATVKKVHGSDATGSVHDTAHEQLEAKAAEILKAEPKLTTEQALAKAYDQNPELTRQARGRRVVEEEPVQ